MVDSPPYTDRDEKDNPLIAYFFSSIVQGLHVRFLKPLPDFQTDCRCQVADTYLDTYLGAVQKVDSFFCSFTIIPTNSIRCFGRPFSQVLLTKHLVKTGNGTMTKFLLICLGSAVGGGARYLVSGWALGLFGTAYPYSTLTVNVVGSFLIGIVMHLGLATEIFSPTARIVLATGVLGGFTTYSSFNYETLQYFQDGEILRGVINVFMMVSSCLIAGLIGLGLAKRLIGG